VLEDQFSLNSTLLRTLGALFLRPGMLTTEYFKLRIARYVPPFRLYIISSLLFFLLLSFMTRGNRLTIDNGVRSARDSVNAALDRDTAFEREKAEIAAAGGDTVRRFRIGFNRDTATAGVRFGMTGDSVGGNWADSMDVNLGNERLNRIARERLHVLGELPPEVAFRRLIQASIENTPKVMFLLLPLYAFLLKLFYIRRKRLYVEHFIFALHVHAFAFLLFFAMLAFRNVPVVSAVLFFWLPFYILLAMKRVYVQGWFKTITKWWVSGWLYMILLTFGVAVAFIGAIFTA
jgi:hypothetical protein